MCCGTSFLMLMIIGIKKAETQHPVSALIF